MKQSELDFTSFKVTNKRVVLELPSQAAGGLIYLDSKTKALDQGWFRVMATGVDVTNCKAGDEVFVVFSNEPYHYDEIIFRPRTEQLKDVQSEKFAESLVVNIGAPKGNIFKVKPIERKFCEVGEYDIHFVRDYRNESIK